MGFGALDYTLDSKPAFYVYPRENINILRAIHA